MQSEQYQNHDPLPTKRARLILKREERKNTEAEVGKLGVEIKG